jgi:hypothetical protein
MGVIAVPGEMLKYQHNCWSATMSVKQELQSKGKIYLASKIILNFHFTSQLTPDLSQG